MHNHVLYHLLSPPPPPQNKTLFCLFPNKPSCAGYTTQWAGRMYSVHTRDVREHPIKFQIVIIKLFVLSPIYDLCVSKFPL